MSINQISQINDLSENQPKRESRTVIRPVFGVLEGKTDADFPTHSDLSPAVLVECVVEHDEGFRRDPNFH